VWIKFPQLFPWNYGVKIYAILNYKSIAKILVELDLGEGFPEHTENEV
jgi:hypothetical protein